MNGPSVWAHCPCKKKTHLLGPGEISSPPPKNKLVDLTQIGLEMEIKTAMLPKRLFAKVTK